MVIAAYDAPFNGCGSKAGARAFPAMLPLAQPEVGGADQQQRCHDALTRWSGCPVHVIFSDRDGIFPFKSGEAWAAQIPGATIGRIESAGHFVQADAPPPRTPQPRRDAGDRRSLLQTSLLRVKPPKSDT
jgi:haloalkane dehalogenase